MEVWNVGKGGYRKCPLGQGKVTIDIDTLIHHSGGSQVLNIPLDYRNSRQGVVSLRLHIDPVDETGKSKQDPIQSDGSAVRRNILCQIDNLRASQLADTGNLFDKQDPSVTITLGSRIFQTARLILYLPTMFIRRTYRECQQESGCGSRSKFPRNVQVCYRMGFHHGNL